jgi:hypothetical protein
MKKSNEQSQYDLFDYSKIGAETENDVLPQGISAVGIQNPDEILKYDSERYYELKAQLQKESRLYEK